MTLTAHVDHVWKSNGPCVYCSCGERLYQGKLPDGYEARVEFAKKFDKATEDAIKGIAIKEAQEWARRTKEQEAAYAEGYAYVSALKAKGTVTPGPLDRLKINPHTPAKINETAGLSEKSKREHAEKRLMMWWNWGWNDADNGAADRRKA